MENNPNICFSLCANNKKLSAPFTYKHTRILQQFYLLQMRLLDIRRRSGKFLNGVSDLTLPKSIAGTAGRAFTFWGSLSRQRSSSTIGGFRPPGIRRENVKHHSFSFRYDWKTCSIEGCCAQIASLHFVLVVKLVQIRGVVPHV